MPQEDTAVATRPSRQRASFTDQLIEPLSRLRSEVDRLFDDFPARWPSFSLGPLAAAVPAPAIEMSETEKAYKLTVEVPGMEAEDIEVTVDDRMLVISGEKREEHEEKDKDYLYTERSYGSFDRRIALPAAADAEKIAAKVKKGVLEIRLPKTANAGKAKRKIAITAA